VKLSTALLLDWVLWQLIPDWLQGILQLINACRLQLKRVLELDLASPLPRHSNPVVSPIQVRKVQWPLILADESGAVGGDPVLCHTCSVCRYTVLLENEARNVLQSATSFGSKNQRKVWCLPWPSLVWCAIVLYRWSRCQPKLWHVVQTWLFEPEGDSYPYLTLLPDSLNMVVLIVYRRVEIEVLLVSEKHLLCSCLWQTSKKFSIAFKAFLFDCVPDDLCWDTAKCSRTKIVFCNLLDRRAMNVQFCSDLSSFEYFCWFKAGLLVNKSVHRPFQCFWHPYFFCRLRKFEKWTSSLERQ